jgi:hypothetical protein
MTAQGGNALSLIKAVHELVAGRRTGVLDVRAGGVRTRIYFEDGNPVFAEDDAPGETFGRLLVRQGVITNDQFIRVIDQMTLAATGDNQLRFGEVAVGQGVLTPEQVERGLADQVRGIISRALQRDGSQWAFDASPGAAKPPRSFSLDLDPTVLGSVAEKPASQAAPRPDPRAPAEGISTKRHFLAPDASTHAARMAAEQAFQKGMALLRVSQTASAAIELRRAYELQPESLEYLLYATWAEARRRREIPSASDQLTLLEIAQRAKRRDPLFAFGSYVLGQLSLWAGDDATAKKWFYEALRLDPASEAMEQVRILARRGTGTPEPPGTEMLPERDKTTERAPLPVSEPVQAATKPVGPSDGPSKRWASRLLVPGAALLVTAAVVIFGATRKSTPSAVRASGSSPQLAFSVDSALPADSETKDTSAPADGRGAGLTASDPVPGKKRPKATRDTELDGAGRGTVHLPSRASGHRIFVDGRRVEADGIAPLHLSCGPHVIRIGSRGTPTPIDLPCRGDVQLQ